MEEFTVKKEDLIGFSGKVVVITGDLGTLRVLDLS